jgi:predicted branched-subunit amino acid permease
VVRSDLNEVVGAAGSVLIFAGASQLSLVELNVEGAAWYVAVGTALAINARFVLYSAALAPAFSGFPTTWRWGLPHLMTDQAATLSLLEYETERHPVARRWFYLGAALILFTFWQAGTLVGLLAGAQVPDGLQLGFIIPLMFTALAVPAINRRPAVVAAVVAVTVTVLASGLPPGTNILVGGLCGIAAGAAVDPGSESEEGQG